MAESVVLRIQGMTCGHCTASVSKALKSVAGVSQVDVSLEKGEARVTHSGAALATLKKAVEEEGYQVINSQP